MRTEPYLQDADFTLHNGDALEVLRTLPDESVHMCVTSPPFYGLRDYGTGTWEGGDVECDHKPPMGEAAGLASSTLEGGKKTTAHQQDGYGQTCGKCGATRIDRQIGLEETPEQWVQKLVEVFREVRRVLRRDGTLFIEVGDSYASQRAPAYDMGGTAPEGSPARDSSSSRLCGECREAQAIGTPRSDVRPAPTPGDDSPDPSRGHRESLSGRSPTSDSENPTPTLRSSPATPGLLPSEDHAAAPLLGAQESTTPSGAPSPPSPSDCEVCGASLQSASTSALDARASAHRSAYSGGTSASRPSSADRTQDTESSDSAYPYLSNASLKPKDLIGAPPGSSPSPSALTAGTSAPTSSGHDRTPCPSR